MKARAIRVVERIKKNGPNCTDADLRAREIMTNYDSDFVELHLDLFDHIMFKRKALSLK